MELEAEAPAGGRKKNRLIAAFLSPPEEGMEMWRPEGEDGRVGFVWCSSAVQLQSDLAVANSGGMSAHVDSTGVLVLRSHGAVAGQSTSIRLNLRERVMDFVGRLEDPKSLMGSAEEGSGQVAGCGNAPGTISTFTMQLMELECYRLPGQSVEVTRSHRKSPEEIIALAR